ncbi:MAG: Gfo/Idh/MocA family protein [Anaerolineae bacterium]
MSRLKMGYVGCGFMAQRVHLPNFLSLSDCQVVALAEVRPVLREKVGARLGISRLYASHLELAADPEIQAVAVSAGQSVQGDIARDLLLAGKHVFMEKPMAVSTAQAEELLAAARTSGKKLMVAYMKRFDAGHELAKQTLDDMRSSGEMGKLLFARSHAFCGDWIAGLDTPMDTTDEPMPSASPARLPAWMPPAYGRHYIDYLQDFTHNLNLLRWFLDAGEVRVESVSLDDDGYTGVVVMWLNGVRTVLETGLLNHYAYDEDLTVYLADGWIKAWSPPLLHKNLPAKVEVYRGGKSHSYSYPLPTDAWSWSYTREAEAFVRAVLDDTPLLTSGDDTLHDVRAFEDIYGLYLQGKGVI